MARKTMSHGIRNTNQRPHRVHVFLCPQQSGRWQAMKVFRKQLLNPKALYPKQCVCLRRSPHPV